MSKLICEKISIYLSGELQRSKKAHFYEACTIVTCEIIHSEDVKCNMEMQYEMEWHKAKY